MKGLVKIIVGLSVSIVLVSCTSSYERQGNAAYQKAKKLTGDDQRHQQKTAYIMYQKAIDYKPDAISEQLRERFIEMTLVRAMMVLNEGAAHMDALPLYMEDIEKYSTGTISSELKTEYSAFLMQMADSSRAKNRFQEALFYFEKARTFSSNSSTVETERKKLIDDVARENFENAINDFKYGKSNKDADALVRAEYYAKAALLYDSAYPGAKELLVDLYKENRGTLSAYLKVISPIVDSATFRKINRFDILLSVPAFSIGSGNASATVVMYNYSNNPQRMLAEYFFVVDESGNKFKGSSSAPLTPEFLDQEHEGTFKLSFPGANGKLSKVIFETEGYYSEKQLY